MNLQQNSTFRAMSEKESERERENKRNIFMCEYVFSVVKNIRHWMDRRRFQMEFQLFLLQYFLGSNIWHSSMLLKHYRHYSHIHHPLTLMFISCQRCRRERLIRNSRLFSSLDRKKCCFSHCCLLAGNFKWNLSIFSGSNETYVLSVPYILHCRRILITDNFYF